MAMIVFAFWCVAPTLAHYAKCKVGRCFGRRREGLALSTFLLSRQDRWRCRFLRRRGSGSRLLDGRRVWPECSVATVEHMTLVTRYADIQRYDVDLLVVQQAAPRVGRRWSGVAAALADTRAAALLRRFAVSDPS
jgi:hypothetical protein